MGIILGEFYSPVNPGWFTTTEVLTLGQFLHHGFTIAADATLIAKVLVEMRKL